MNTETAGHDHIRLIVKRQEGPTQNRIGKNSALPINRI